MGTVRMSFEQCVLAHPELQGAYRQGLQAVSKACRERLAVETQSKLEGSVDLDATTRARYPQAARWDYLVGYGEELYAIELHPASTSNIREVLSKLTWLRGWLQASPVDSFRSYQRVHYHWIATGTIALTKKSSHYRQLAQQGLLPKKHLRLA